MLPKLSAFRNKVLQASLRCDAQLWFNMHSKVLILAHLKTSKLTKSVPSGRNSTFHLPLKAQGSGLSSSLRITAVRQLRESDSLFRKWEQNVCPQNASCTDGTEFRAKKTVFSLPLSRQAPTEQFCLQNGEAKIRQKSSISNFWKPAIFDNKNNKWAAFQQFFENGFWIFEGGG